MLFLYNLAQHVQEMPYSLALRESLWVYPIVETAHVLGLCLFVGTAWLWDLRLLGWTLRRVPVSELSAQILPWTVIGFVVMAASGVALVFSEPLRFYSNIFFRIKVVLLFAAAANAFLFHQTVGRRKESWNLDARPPFRARLAGGVSLGVWAAVIVTGRLIAYNWFGAVRP
jgi:hypothetical protein